MFKIDNYTVLYVEELLAESNSRVDDLIAGKITFSNCLDQFSNAKDNEQLVFFTVVLRRYLEAKGLSTKPQES
jgi:hypothetical protein